MAKVGDTIRIIGLEDPYASHYIGKTGVVEIIETDPWGETRLGGTWGGIFIYPLHDQIEIIG